MSLGQKNCEGQLTPPGDYRYIGRDVVHCTSYFIYLFIYQKHYSASY